VHGSLDHDIKARISVARNTQVRLLVILLNPPLLQGGARTLMNVEVAGHVLNATSVETVNLVNVATRDLPELNRVGSQAEPWLEARTQLHRAIGSADAVLAAWGLGGFSRNTRANFEDQRSYMTAQICLRDFGGVWSVAGRPRHPSRWRQYLGPEKARVEGANFEERLSRSLVKTDICSLY